MIILFGVVGSGKSEQAKRLVAKLGCPHISTSRLLREKSNPEWDKSIMEGRLVDDQDVFSLLQPELEKADAAHKELILDGAPRSVGQAKWLIEKIKSGEVKFTGIIHLNVSKETVKQRLQKRGRDDDQEHIIEKRFEQYDNLTDPVLDYFRSHGFTINEVDGSYSIDDVEKAIWDVLKDKISASEV